MTSLEDFVRYEGELIGVRDSSKLLKSEEVDARQKYRIIAALLAEDLSGGRVKVTNSTPDSALDGVYSVAMRIKEEIASGYFAKNKVGIVNDFDDNKLADNDVVFRINHMTTGDTDHDSAVEVIGKYKEIKFINESYDGNKEINGKTLGRDDLLNYAIPFVQEGVVERLDEKFNKDNEYISDEAKNLTQNALFSIISTTPEAPRIVTNLIEQKYMKEYQEKLTDNSSKARVVRTSILNNKNEQQARNDLLTAA